MFASLKEGAKHGLGVQMDDKEGVDDGGKEGEVVSVLSIHSDRASDAGTDADTDADSDADSNVQTGADSSSDIVADVDADAKADPDPNGDV